MAQSREMSRTRPQRPVPPGACDCHFHVYEPQFPLTHPGGSTPLLSGTLNDYRVVRERLGLTRAVVVQPGAYGFDNRCTLGAMAALGEDARGVAIVDPQAPDAEFGRLTRLGVKGVRYHMMHSPALAWETLTRMAARVSAFGWHVQLQCEPPALLAHAQILAGLPCDLVIDHMGRFRQPLAAHDAAWRFLRRLIDGGRCWVKVSAPYHGSRSGPPRYEDRGALARELIRAAPERMVWATNWPHPSVRENFPDEAALLDLLADWTPDEATRHAILVGNPARLYGFPAQ
jgi:D-galactarolactone isomerase